MLTTRIKKIDERAVIPTKASDGSAGYDLTFIGIDKIVDDVIFFKTGLTIQSPKNHYFELAPRSSISKLPLMLANSIGQIDEDYRGEIIAAIRVLHDHQGNGPQHEHYAGGIVRIFSSKPPTMLAVAEGILRQKPVLVQLILRERLEVEWEEVAELESSVRGDGGFGSTDNAGKAKFRPGKEIRPIETVR